MRTVVSNIDILVFSVEPERRQAGIWAIDYEVWCSIWWLNSAFLQSRESFSQCSVHLREARVCCYRGRRSEQCDGLCFDHDWNLREDAKYSESWGEMRTVQLREGESPSSTVYISMKSTSVTSIALRHNESIQLQLIICHLLHCGY